MSLSEIQAEHRRIAILRLLAEMPQYRSNASMLTEGIMRVANLVGTRVQVLADIDYLAEVGAVAKEELGNGIVAVELTERGHDAAEGRASLPGVKRPGPRSRG